jgi:hypothetical protein
MHVRGNWIIRYSDDVENPPSVTNLVIMKWVVTEKLRRRRVTTLKLAVTLHTCSTLCTGYCTLCTGYCTLCTGYSLQTCTRLSYWNLHSTTKQKRSLSPDVAVHCTNISPFVTDNLHCTLYMSPTFVAA